MPRHPRRRVDWRLTAGDDPPRARLVPPSTHYGALAQITAALLSDPSAQTVDSALRVSMEFARTVIHLERVAIFLVGPDGQSMMGTWGTDADGRSTDEHDIVFEIDEITRQFFARATHGYAWSVY